MYFFFAIQNLHIFTYHILVFCSILKKGFVANTKNINLFNVCAIRPMLISIISKLHIFKSTWANCLKFCPHVVRNVICTYFKFQKNLKKINF